MISREPITLTFAASEFVVRPLTLAQVEKIEDHLLDLSLGQGTRRGKAILQVALSRDNGSVDLDALEGSARDLSSAVESILVLGGFVMAPAPGEAGAAAQTAPAGDISAAA